MVTDRTCSVDGCDKPLKSRGMCIMHYTRWRTAGGPVYKPREMTPFQGIELPRGIVDRLTTDPATGCWLWIGPTNNGYGVTSRLSPSPVHRYVYTLLVGEPPEGLVLDHLCRVRQCCNPAHLEPTTIQENVRRGFRLKTHCKHGHEFTPENTRLNRLGHRSCRACANERRRK